MGLLKKIISEEAPILVFSFLNFYLALAVSIVLPITDILMDRERAKPRLFVALKIPVLMLLSVVVAQAYGTFTFISGIPARDFVGALAIIFWVHLYLNQKLQEVVE